MDKAKDQMNNCLKMIKFKIKFNEKNRSSENFNIQSTPTIYINDKKYDGKHQYTIFDKEIKKLL